MPNTSRRRTRACANCKEKHAKCNGQRPCSLCIRSGSNCVDPTSIRFRDVARSKKNLRFSADQIWLETKTCDRLAYVDETASVPQTLELEELSQEEESETSEQGPSLALVETTHQQQPHQHPEVLNYSISCEDHTSDTLPTPTTSRHDIASPVLLHHGVIGTPSTFATLSLASPSSSSAHPSQSANIRELGVLESCLMRHFVFKIANMFDTTDRDRHFELTVPHRALRSSVLFYAICTIAAGDLVGRTKARENFESQLPFSDNVLSNLTEESVLSYHNKCINLLIEISSDPAQMHNEDALAAAVILRTHEQMDMHATSFDAEVYLNVVQVIIKTVPDSAFGSFHTTSAPTFTKDISAPPPTSLGYSTLLVALRQEIYSTFLQRRPFRLFSRTDKGYQPAEPAGDFEWTNHIMFWCADVLRFCFGDTNDEQNKHGLPESRLQRWKYLKGFERNWDLNTPLSFRPYYHQKASPAEGRYFPVILHMNDCQVMGLQYLEMARILLVLYDPQRQHIGLGTTAYLVAAEDRVRRSVLHMCGLGLSNMECQPLMVTAALAIAAAGEYFRETGIQTALIEFLVTVDKEHAWPTNFIIEGLQRAWELRGDQ